MQLLHYAAACWHANRRRQPDSFLCDITSSRPDVFHCEADWKVAKDASKVVPVLSEVPHRDDIGGSGRVASHVIYVSTRLR
jgi:hypothetical protein